MTLILKKEIKQYLKQISLLLPIKRKEERVFLSYLKDTIEDFVESNPECMMNDIILRFEDPQTVVYNYLSALDQQQLCKKVSLRKHIQIGIIIVLLLITLLTVFRMALFYDIYLEEKEQIIHSEESIIE
ncbi:MAG: DUF6120 family protein [Clostridia bacterium]